MDELFPGCIVPPATSSKVLRSLIPLPGLWRWGGPGGWFVAEEEEGEGEEEEEEGEKRNKEERKEDEKGEEKDEKRKKKRGER
ncbi:hypothetical protein EYF80_023801 [Liparis tanakae]|uniref:Uncharacterized protein n=1 Tax=Liparis tanakae TaxID=230148 RepID=A0A4Z2HJD9_9TELE|nr:hypothetical protein EYF80_023801 [Liparis tanakae]